MDLSICKSKTNEHHERNNDIFLFIAKNEFNNIQEVISDCGFQFFHLEFFFLWNLLPRTIQDTNWNMRVLIFSFQISERWLKLIIVDDVVF